MELEINQRVKVVKTTDPVLDGSIATVIGSHTPGYAIIRFYGKPPVGYNPAIVLSQHCLEVLG